MNILNGWLQTAEKIPSPHFDQRPSDRPIDLLVIHNISLPPNQFGGHYIDQLFLGTLDEKAHPYFKQIHQLRVSAHNLITRNGHIKQYVSYDARAWHAGMSSFQGQSRCNDNAIGIELEGSDHVAYAEAQYESLIQLTKALVRHYPNISLGRVVGHNDIAPQRKTDPGQAFDWARFRQGVFTNQ